MAAISMTSYGPTQRIRQRGDTLTGPLLTVEFSSPSADGRVVTASPGRTVTRHVSPFSLL